MEPHSFEIRVLGPLEVDLGAHSVTPRARKQRVLLADLVLRLGTVVSADILVDDLWGADPPATARHALQVYVSQLRRALPENALETHPAGYRLELDPAQVDTLRFEQLLADARGAPATGAAEVLRDALGLWRGPAYADFTYEPWAQGEIARLDELRQDALELRVDADLALGRTDLVAELEALILASPLRERLRAQLMLALYRAGRQSDALAQFHAARETLLEELGVEPGPALRELQAAILRHDDALALPVATPPTPRRKLVTILFADVVESTRLATELDPEAYESVLRRYFDVAAAAVARHGGAVEKFVGDAVMAVFGAPLAHEDDALRALRAAMEIRDGVRALDESLARELDIRLALRIGIASGEVLTAGTSTAGRLATGAPVTHAARLQQAGAAGEITVDALTRRLTDAACRYEPLGELELRGAAEPGRAFRLVELTPEAPAVARRLDAQFVGREAELAALERDYRKAAARRQLRAATLIGSAGIGKTRLAREFLTRVAEEATIRMCRFAAYGEASAYRALREALGSREEVLAALAGAPDAEAVADRLQLVLGGESTASVDEVPWAFRRFCEALATQRPLVLVFDDLHWAQPALLDLIDHLAERSNEAPILLLCIGREELLAGRPGLPGARIELDPLSAEQTDELAQRIEAAPLPDAARERCVAAAEGNPLFLEQLLAHAAETGSLEPPPTIRALLAARLDRLGPGERGVLDRAAVAGRDVPLDELTELLDPEAAPTAARHLDALVERRLLRRGRDGSFRFHHGLIQDAAYRGIPKGLRAELHERYADVLDRKWPDDELVGYHLEQAAHLCAELGRRDRRALRLAEDAGALLGTAGLRAMKRTDVAAASNLLGRAATLLPTSGALRREILCELGVVLGTAGDPDGADRAFADARAVAAAAGDRATEVRAELEAAARRVLTDPEGAAARFLELSSEAIPILTAHGDDRALGRVWMLTGWVHGGVHGRHALWAEAAERALDHYRRSGWPSSSCLAQIASALYFGPTHVDEAISRCGVLLDQADDLGGDASVRAYLAGLVAMRGRFNLAVDLLRECRDVFEQLGQLASIARVAAPIAGQVSLLAGDSDAAERSLRESCTLLQRVRDRNPLATQAAELAEVLYRRGGYDEAEHWVEVARENAASDDVGPQCLWRSVAAKLRARERASAAAEALAREAITLCGATDNLDRRARMHSGLGEVLTLDGRTAEAAREAKLALQLLEQKGNAVAAERVRALLSAPARA